MDRQGLEVGLNTEQKLPYAIWNVGEEELKLKLTTSNIVELERKFNQNLLTVIANDELPTLTTMLTIIQASLNNYHHGYKTEDIYNLYDKYVENGGSMTDLFANVIMPLMSASGFFTKEQRQIVESELNTTL